MAYLQIFNGTPFKNVIWRLLGVRLGRGVFDDGLSLTERMLVTIGANCTFNAGSGVQSHSQEDGAFKSDRGTIGAGCTLGVGAFVHYGVTIGDGAVLAPDSFLMKGEEVPPHAYWGGNPAREMPAPATLGANPIPKMPVLAALGANSASEMPVPAAVGANPTREMPVPATVGANPTRETPVPATVGANPTREFQVPVAREMPVPATLVPATLKVLQDRDESRSVALASASSPCQW
jgi:hypothetical protein